MRNDQTSKQTRQTDRTEITTLINIPAYIFISPAAEIDYTHFNNNFSLFTVISGG